MSSKIVHHKLRHRLFHHSNRLSYFKRFLLALISFGLVWFVMSPYSNFNPHWQEPPRFVSKDRKLDVTLRAQDGPVLVNGERVMSKAYNGIYPGPVFEIRGGDTFKVKLENQLSESTNLHFHGSHVSPKGHSDNVLLDIKPGETFNYEYHLPVNHPPGLYWYHPHYHPNVEDQVLGGMAGAIIVRGNVDELKGIKGVPERLLLLTTQDGNNPNTPARLVNGQSMPTLYMRPGETQRWEIANMSADDYYNFAIPGKKLHIFSRDGNTLDQVVSVDNEVMAPGDRIQILVQADWWGSYEVKSLKFDEGFAHYEETSFMKVRIAGLPIWPKELPTKLLPYNDLRNTKVDNTRTLTFSMGGTNANPTFLLDGKAFNPNVIDQVMTLGTTEEWRLVNESNEVHPFHIHINPFQVLSVNGKPINRHGYDDTFPIPAKSTVVIRTQYKDFDGKYVLHCHILFHEDHGMMQVVEVVKPGNKQETDNGIPGREGMLMEQMDHTGVNDVMTEKKTRYQKAYE